ncbi:MAG: MCE family protein [Acidobacteria bacterium]|nr:MCE family protein [Acidobacteriota bacterium]
MRDETRRSFRVGLLVLAALTVLSIGVFVIGKRQQLFVLHTRYYTTFRDVLGLQPGAPVTLSGVTVGFVQRIDLPQTLDNRRIVVRFTVNARYTERIRKDTIATIRTEGLLGDRYLTLRGGTTSSPRVLEGGMVRGVDSPELARFVSSGAELMDNLLAISASLKTILARVQRGEGVIGALTAGKAHGQPVARSFADTLTSLDHILKKIDEGHGLAGRALSDDAYARRVFDDIGATAAAARKVTTQLAADTARNDTAYAALLRDPEGRQLTHETLVALSQASQALAAAAQELASGKGTLPRLLGDREYAGRFLDDLEGLTHALRSVADKLDRGRGTAGAFINDPQMYKDLENIVRGVKSSKVLSWFIRNRRRKGETIEAKTLKKQRHKEQR